VKVSYLQSFSNLLLMCISKKKSAKKGAHKMLVEMTTTTGAHRRPSQEVLVLVTFSHSRFDFTNIFTRRFYAFSSQKRKSQSSRQYLFTLLGSTRVKAVHRTLMKLSPVSAKRQLKHRNMLVGKTTVRMNSEPLLGRRSAKQKHSLSMGESTSATPSQPPPPIPPRTGLIPRRDFGPAASNPRPPMLRFSRGSWLSKPTEEQPSTESKTCSGKKTSQSKSSRRHSAPPVSSRASRQASTVTLFNTTSLAEITDKGTCVVV